MKYKSKPAEIEAIKYTGDNKDEIYKFAGEAVTPYYGSDGKVMVHTLNGSVELLLNHYIIKGKNDFYPCDPDTFESRWEPNGGDQS
jgi:hypothetical protein